MEDKAKIIKLSVRTLVEFILCSGDLDNRRTGKKDVEAMQEGSRIHRKIQKRMGSNYTAEFPLSINLPIHGEGIDFEILLEGRADGIINNIDEKPAIVIDEIKAMYMDLSYLEEAIPVHVAQAKCYAYMYAKVYEHSNIGIRLTYCNIETENIKYFEYEYSFDELEAWFKSVIDEYSKWAIWEYKWALARNESIKELEFPFDYRVGQKKLVTDVYKTIIREKRLFIEAPTGVGKTISTVFPTIKAMGEGHINKIFYLTAKTITRTVAEETAKILQNNGLKLKAVTITAKDKICILDKPDCNPVACERAKGHYDRVNDAVFDLINNEDEITRDLISEYATKHMVCPFEMGLDVTNWSDYIVCDYNYVFDPNVYLRRFFNGDKKKDYAFLIDEAHNLVERARQMYSGILYKKDFLAVKRIVKDRSKKFSKCLDICNKDLITLKRECESVKKLDNITDFVLHLLRLMTEYEEYMREFPVTSGEEEITKLYLDVWHFLNIYEIYNDKYITYTDYDEDDEFRIKLLCMDPSTNLSNCLDKGKSAIFFSATLLPIQYYKEQLGGREGDYAVYAETPFDKRNRVIMIGNDVSTKYSRRNQDEYEKIVDYIIEFTSTKKGNYMVFFPSYQMLNQIAELCTDKLEGMVLQKNQMSEKEKEEFLNDFTLNPEQSRVGFCVMGGIFSEGIDLKSDRLIGVVIVGTGLPMVCNEKELFRTYYDEVKGCGFDYAYLYQGMNKVLQSAGRVIRTMEDRGAILLLDDRFTNSQYNNLFPREWYPYEIVDVNKMKNLLEEFWDK